MSNAVQIAGAVVGGAVGFIIGGPAGAAFGASLGYGAAAIASIDTPAGPRLEDLKVQRSSYGDALKVVIGNARVAGTVIWIGEVKEFEREEGGKGGGGATVYSYKATFAIGVCQGPDFQLGKIWADTDVIYDGQSTPTKTADGLVVQTGNGPASGAGTISVFLGAEDQAASTIIQEFDANSPAYRGVCYVLFEEFDLERYGNRIPNFSFAVGSVQDPIIDVETEYKYANRDLGFPENRLTSSGSAFIDVATNAKSDDWAAIVKSKIASDGYGINYASDFANEVGYTLLSGEAAASGAPTGYASAPTSVIGPLPKDQLKNDPRYPDGFLGWAIPSRVTTIRNAIPPDAFLNYVYPDTRLPPLYSTSTLCEVVFGGNLNFHVVRNIPGGVIGGVITRIDPDDDGSVDIIAPWNGTINTCPIDIEGELVADGVGIVGNFYVNYNEDRNLQWEVGYELRSDTYSFEDECSSVFVGGYSPTTGTFKAVAWPELTSAVAKNGLGLVIKDDHPYYSDQAFWELIHALNLGGATAQNAADTLRLDYDTPAAPLDQAVPNNSTAYTDYEDWVYGVDYPTQRTVDGTETLPEDQVFAQQTTYEFWCLSGLLPEEIPVSYVIRKLLTTAGVPIEHINVSAVTGNMSGYVIEKQMTVERALGPLLKTFSVDAYENDGTIVFKSRGNDATDVIAKDSIGIYGDDDPVVSTLTQDWDLPKTLSLTYQDPSADYIENTQRQTFDSIYTSIDADLKVPITMSNNVAAQRCEIVLHSQWAERESITFTIVDAAKMTVAPTDVIQIGYDGWTYEVRLMAVQYLIPSTVKCQGVIQQKLRQEQQDDAAVVFVDYEVYDSDAEGEDTSHSPESPKISGDTIGYYMDVPNSDTGASYEDSAGFLVSGRGTGEDWTAGTVYKSQDQINYEVASGVTPAVITGTIDSLANGNEFVQDFTNTVRVTLDDSSKELSSVTKAQLLSGSNACYIGAHGRWEVVQFQTATLVSAGVYDLTGLLRGRLGTESYMDDHVAEDTFVLGTAAFFSNFAMSNSQINQQFYLKALSQGQYLPDVTATTFTSAAVRLHPYAPTSIRANRNAANDIIITWQRRDRHSAQTLWQSPMSESVESYEIDIVDTGVVRTITGLTSETATYTSADQIADFGSNQSSVTIRIYQVSAITGRGTQAEATV